MGSSGEFWLIAAPGEKTCHETWDRLNKATSDVSMNHKFALPDLKVGTLDQLVGLSDDLGKLDTFAEGVTRKLVQYTNEVINDTKDKLYEHLQVNGKDMISYLTKFQWETAKYPVKQSLRMISEQISKTVSQIDGDLKTKSSNYNNLKNNLASLERKATGSLITKDLSDVVKKEHFIMSSEHLITVLVVVPKLYSKDWEAKYERLTDMVVPRSSVLLYEDGDNCLFSVSLFRRVLDDYKMRCRENKFVVRDFVYDEESLAAGRNERDKLIAETQRAYAPLMRWLKINFGELYSAWIHVKALRVFVESVLRYGLPVNFQAMLLQTPKRQQKRLREVLFNLYKHLDSANMGSHDKHAAEIEDLPGLHQFGEQDYYPYVFFKVNVDLLDK